MSGYKYTFIVQCKELIDHAHSRIIATCRIEDNVGGFMKALGDLNKDPKKIKQIYIGEIDLEHAPLMQDCKEL